MFGFDLFKQTTYLHACRLIEAGRFAAALPLLNKLVDDGELQEPVVTAALCCALHQGQWDLAERYVNHIEAKAYNGADALFWRIDYYFAQDHVDSGQELLQRLLADYPHDTGLLWDVADMLLEYEFSEPYWQILETITQVKTTDPYELLDQADAYLTLGEQSRAAEYAIRAAAVLPADNAADLFYSAAIVEQCEHIREALTVYQQGVERFPAAAEFVLGLVRCLVALGEFAAAERQLVLVQHHNPELPGLTAALKAVAKAKRKIVDFQSYRDRTAGRSSRG